MLASGTVKTNSATNSPLCAGMAQFNSALNANYF